MLIKYAHQMRLMDIVKDKCETVFESCVLCKNKERKIYCIKLYEHKNSPSTGTNYYTIFP